MVFVVGDGMGKKTKIWWTGVGWTGVGGRVLGGWTGVGWAGVGCWVLGGRVLGGQCDVVWVVFPTLVSRFLLSFSFLLFPNGLCLWFFGPLVFVQRVFGLVLLSVIQKKKKLT
jgi:hypothetical protein